MTAPRTVTPRFLGAEGVRPDGTPILTISVCPRCASRWFPPREICSACAHDVLEPADMGRDGIAYASTVVRIGPPGFTAPYVLSYVDIDGVRLLAHTDVADPGEPQALLPDTPVVVTAGPIGTTGDVELWAHRVHAAGPQEDER